MNEQMEKLHKMLSDPEFQKLPYLDQTMNIYYKVFHPELILDEN
jgi:hypothetical protein